MKEMEQTSVGKLVERTWDNHYGISYQRACELEGNDSPRISAAVFNFEQLTKDEQLHVIDCKKAELKEARQQLTDARAAAKRSAEVSRKLNIKHQPYREPTQQANQRIKNLTAQIAQLKDMIK